MKQSFQKNIAFLTFRFIIRDIVWDLLYWPIWWYSFGLIEFVDYILHEISRFEERLGLRIWIANLFRPMYAQYDWQGRLISFFMRFFVILFKAVIFLLWIFLLSILLLLWIAVPLFAIYQIVLIFIKFFH